MSHRKKRRAINEPGHAHFLTFSCWKRWPLLNRDRSRQWVIDALNQARLEQQMAIWAYVIMPEHLHLLIAPQPREYEMRVLLAAVKSPVSRKAKAFLVETGNTEWLTRLTTHHGDRTVFRFWQPGGGYDENLWNARPIREVIDYIHANPVRRGLVERPTDWKWSSARAHAGLSPVVLEVDQAMIE
ncbi:REP-associated tyrosine transposase [Planctomicrobium piriforme]|uniref:REP-associated tyrosine transposase n=1 Tax=Planctomicrobium piriforme TaxID=1576369 RepID=UPI0015873B8E|nr:transposase [Planctomicrobium piriforme]